ncbi:flagellar basal body P-ring formation protein FlgA [Pectobacterium aroidearum]|jgi:flagella basal body P-ring formation protein FlgA|uniref:Flagella basal body P-ring formation protein FlgA n=1 Tax=Pectobacterium aroidearum TaxID=1201031 RepID=A0AAW3SU44_9GAMM|nr:MULTISPECIES: flagellar basal body P-ring formation chaperone FlgA [Pectobacterium]MBA5198831.1 flagellar basal body P-ring formation protein FlgA [Pectobacterium aroidearum]MBA5203122.1 flagellar basal body P-ring formation protein FlgA [Pectobacterium aroidearum]MBA5226666.1 flagellar basal body P-ring formation protein FlgA [Pectobacterium aroidearum]MBA5231623.1 flagellar basal body P-ring formation protein FlgA [Pectobacterium aroidearum]MBA5238850.1 flagellar basal body P-ring formati
MKTIYYYLCLATSCFFTLCAPVNANDLPAQINQFFASRFQGSPNTVNVVIKSPESQWPQCEAPQITLPGNTKMWGNVSLSIRCGQQRRFIQTEVQVTGNYVTSSRPINRGTTLTEKDISLTKGRLDLLPLRPILTLQGAQGAVLLRDLTPGQVITASMIRRAWVVKAGQSVQIIAQGEGFTINGEGKAMNNAAAGQAVRVRTANGQIISGITNEDGIILISQ